MVERRAAQLSNRASLRSSLARWRLQTEMTTAAVARCRQRSLRLSALGRWRRFAARQAWLRSLLRGREEGLARRQLQAWRASARRRAAIRRLLGSALEQRRSSELRNTLQHWKRMARYVTKHAMPPFVLHTAQSRGRLQTGISLPCLHAQRSVHLLLRTASARGILPVSPGPF